MVDKFLEEKADMIEDYEKEEGLWQDKSGDLI
jgi:hypothetical protein